ncbi:MAG TPA: hypothetical protein O0X39_07280 [Methanocorpusculum sp.]|nr:hypothetical protein [Methanocorpusculum sp.]
MKKILVPLLVCMIGLALFAGYGAAEDARGLLEVSCGVESAKISIVSDNTVIETQSPVNGKCQFYVNSLTVPIDKIIAEDYAHFTNAVDFHNSPVPGQRVTTSISPGDSILFTGSNHGYIDVYTNVLGAKVELKTKYNIDTFTGYTNRFGYAHIPIKGEEYRIKTITISSYGWDTEVIDVDVAPTDNNVVTYHAYLNKTPESQITYTQTPVPTKTMVFIGYPTQTSAGSTTSPLPFAGVLAGLGLAVFFLRRD